MRDTLFQEPAEAPFEFNASVAAVFDDMLTRSIPYYCEALALSCDLLADLLPHHARLYDLGCSTATTLLELWRRRSDLELIGIDNSVPMLQQALTKTRAYGAPITLIEGDITRIDLDPSDAIIANYTLQFIRPLERPALVTRLYERLHPGGIFLFSEKTLAENGPLGSAMIRRYYAYKKEQGYSELEIMQKREALENVLIPYTVAENRRLMLEAEFASVDILFSFNNFTTFMAIKEG